MKNLKLVLPIILLALSINVSASVIDNGSYTTVNSLDWLDFTATVNMNQTTALSTFSGYRAATQTEMEDLMNTMFNTTFVWNDYGFSYFNGVTDYQTSQAEFGKLFGFTASGNTFATVEGLGSVGFDSYPYAAFVGQGQGDVGYSSSWSGIALVGVSTVPVPAAAWLFGSALLGFFGFSRRKANA